MQIDFCFGHLMFVVYLLLGILKSFDLRCSFDFIFDAVGGETANFAPSLLLPFTGATYVRVVVPFLSNNNEFGMACGLANSSFQYGTEFLQVINSLESRLPFVCCEL